MYKGYRLRRSAHLVLVVALGVLVYSGTLKVPFQFDDIRNIVDNPIVKNFAYFIDTDRAEGFKQFASLRSRYIGNLTFFLNYRFNGIDVTGYHVINIVVHAINILLVYWLVFLSFHTSVLKGSRYFGRGHPPALLAAALFAVHPINTQAVTYVVQRFASLAALWYLASVAFYIRSRIGKGKDRGLYFAGSLVCAILAMKTKENAFTLPIVITMYEAIFFRGSSAKQRIIFLLPLLLTMLIIPLTMIGEDASTSQVMASVAEKTTIQQIPRGEYFLTELRVVMTYLRLMILPINQTLEYDYPLYSSITRPQVLAALLLLVVLLSFAINLLRRKEPAWKLAGFGVLFFFVTLSVESTVITLYPIYEHRVYLPGVGVIVGVSIGAIYLYDSLKDKSAKLLLASLCAIVIILLAAQTVVRNRVWRSQFALWSDVVEKAPGDARGHMALGIVLDKMEKYREAQHQYLRAIALKPDYADVYVNLGASYGMQGRLSEAQEEINRAIQLDPKNDDAYNNMGNIYFARGDFGSAEVFYKKALELNRGAVSPRVNMIKIFISWSMIDRANEELKVLKRIAPEQAEMLALLIKSK